MREFDDFMEIVRKIRRNCPWDSVQTHESLKKYLLEGIDRLSKENDSTNLCEELGDVLFQVALHSVIAEEEGLFTVEDVIRDVSSKMKFRHPKIFSPEDKQLAGLSWEELKQLEKATEEESEKAEKP